MRRHHVDIMDHPGLITGPRRPRGITVAMAPATMRRRRVITAGRRGAHIMARRPVIMDMGASGLLNREYPLRVKSSQPMSR